MYDAIAFPGVNMKIVIFSRIKCIAEELVELNGINKNEVVFTNTHLQMIHALRKHCFCQAILNIESSLDLTLIKYINEHNREIKIRLFGDDLLNEMIHAIKNSNCEVIRGGIDHE